MKKVIAIVVLFFLFITSYFYLTISAEAGHKWEFGISIRDHYDFIRVTKVRANSIAEKAGIKEGNDIRGFNNYKIRNINEFKSVFNQTYQNHKHKILITKYGNYVGGSISLVVNIDLDKKKFIKKKTRYIPHFQDAKITIFIIVIVNKNLMMEFIMVIGKIMNFMEMENLF